MKFPRRVLLKTLAAVPFLPALAPAQPAPAPIRVAMVEGLSGAFANTGEAVFRNLVWAVERVNQRGGVRTAAGLRTLQLGRHDSKGQNEEAIAALRSAIDGGARIVMRQQQKATQQPGDTAADLDAAAAGHPHGGIQRRSRFHH